MKRKAKKAAIDSGLNRLVVTETYKTLDETFVFIRRWRRLIEAINPPSRHGSGWAIEFDAQARELQRRVENTTRGIEAHAERRRIPITLSESAIPF